MPDQTDDCASPAFELFEGGAFLGLERILRSLRPAGFTIGQKALLSILATWVPMLVLAALQGFALGPTRAESFLLDPAMYARFLLTIPLFFYVQKILTAKFRSITQHFLNAKLVKEAGLEQFCGHIAAAMRLRCSPLADWLQLLLAYGYAFAVFRLVVPDLSASWRMIGPDGHRSLSLAGWWFITVSEPIFAFILFRFIYRLGLWWRLLWQTSRLDLDLDAAHPDGAAGLGFLGLTLPAAQEAAFAISASFAGGLANIVLATGMRVTSFKLAILLLVIVIVGLFAGPLLFFSSLLVKVKSRGALGYWLLWQAQLRQFDRKWLPASVQNPGEGSPAKLDMLGIADFSSFTDLSSILERVQQTKRVPFRRKQIEPLIVAALLPFLAVLLLEVPLEDVVKKLLQMAGL